MPMNAGGSLASAKTSAAATLPSDCTDACSTKDYLQAAVSFSPSDVGVLPSWDLKLPMCVSDAIKSTAPSASAGFEDLLTYSLVAKLTYQSKHEFSLR